MRPAAEVRDRLRFAIEDRFLIFDLWENSALLPTGAMARTLAHIFGSFLPAYSLVCDARRVETLTSDIVDFLHEFADFGPIVLADERAAPDLEADFFIRGRGATGKILPLRGEPPVFDFFEFPLPPSDYYHLEEADYKKWEEIASKIDTRTDLREGEENLLRALHYEFGSWVGPWPTYSEFDDIPLHVVADAFMDAIYAKRYLRHSIPQLARNSLLTHFAIGLAGDNLTAAPYHGHAAYQIESRSSLVLGRPTVLAKMTQALLSDEMEQLSRLLAGRPKEREIQKFLEAHAQIFSSLGYLHVYPQVVLRRDDGTSLLPDFMLQPVGDIWCDILDIKLPDKPVVVGGRDRKTLASCIHELAAQLREYSAYFENPIYARRVEEEFGIKCYRPRLIGIISRDISISDERQLRRLMTAYSDLDIISFDRLLAIAKSRILI